jgi:hypothetical protein
MGNPLFTNNAGTTFANPVDKTDTIVTVVGGGGSLFPNPTGGDYFMVTFISTNGTELEICKCTARAGDTLTVIRAQEGTGAQNFQITDQCQLRITALTMNTIVTAVGSDHVKDIVAGTGISATGTGSVTIANTGVLSLAAGTGISLSGSTGNVTITPTSVPNLITTNFTIQESGGKLIFKYGATTIASLDSSGNFTALANVSGAGTP